MHVGVNFGGFAVCFRELLDKCGLPDRVNFVMIKTACNAWLTSCRFGIRGSPCKLLCGHDDPIDQSAGSSSVIFSSAPDGIETPTATQASPLLSEPRVHPDHVDLDVDDGNIAFIRDRCSDSIWHYSKCRIIERDLSRVLPSAAHLACLPNSIFRYYFFPTHLNNTDLGPFRMCAIVTSLLLHVYICKAW